MKYKEVTIEEYDKEMDKIIKKNLSVDETLMKMLEEASKLKIKTSTKGKKIVT